MSAWLLQEKLKFWQNASSANISDLNTTCKVIYLGNVLTSWAKGDGCVDKPLVTLWKNFLTTEKPKISMKLTVSTSGLKAVTKEHGLTEYWANRITFSGSNTTYPNVFCWIYRHEGRKMKQELRCHAVLCSKKKQAQTIDRKLSDYLHQALIDFRLEKVSRQNARLCLANSVKDQKIMPLRKILLQNGSQNFKLPIEKGKSAPKLKNIDEEDEEEPKIQDKYSQKNEDFTLQTNVDIAECPHFLNENQFCDLSIKSAPISTFSVEEQSKYLQKIKYHKNIYNNDDVDEFCTQI